MTKTQHIKREARLYTEKHNRVFNAASRKYKLAPEAPLRQSIARRIVAPVSTTVLEIWSNVVVVQTRNGKVCRLSSSLVPSSANCGDELIVMVKQKTSDKLRRAAIRTALKSSRK